MRASLLCLVLTVVACSAAGDDYIPPPPRSEMNSAVVVDDAGLVPDLVCPGVQGCEDAEGVFSVGVAKRDITPAMDGEPVWIAGFSSGRQATGVHDPIWVRVLSVSRGKTRLGLVILDVVGYFHDGVLAIRHAAADLGFDQITVASTHNHEAKDTMGIWGATVGESGYDPDYMARIVALSTEALSEARNNERAANMIWATAEAPELIHDSRDPVVIDQRLHAFTFGDVADDEVFASLVVWGNHPEALDGDNTLLTSDYPHYLREAMEAHYPGSTAVFFNGILGGLTNPMHVVGCPDADGNPTCDDATFEKAEYIGATAAAAALEALTTDGTLVPDPTLSFRRNAILLPSSNLVLIFAFGLGLIPRSVVGEDGVVLSPEEAVYLPAADLLEGRAKLQTEVNAFEIGPAAFLTVPGELYAELWLEGEGGDSMVEVPDGADFPDAAIDPPLESYLPDTEPRVVINQANDALGYIIPKTQWDTEEPRAYEPGGQYGEQNSTGVDTAALLNQAVVELFALEAK